MSEIDKIMGKLNQGKVYEIPITENEIKNFERLLNMEAVHNEIAKSLNMFKESIMKSRNEYVQYICKKYQIDKPNFMSFDPFTKNIISTFHPNHQTRIMNQEPKEFIQLAGDMVFKLIQDLTTIHKAVRGK